MYLESMAERTRYLKENPEGVSEMCKILEDMRNESLEEGKREGIRIGERRGEKRGAINTAKKMLATGKYALEEIVNISGLSLDEVENLRTGKIY